MAGGPSAHFTTLPIKACVAAMRQAGLPAAVSNTAGTFVCNHIFYALMESFIVFTMSFSPLIIFICIAWGITIH